MPDNSTTVILQGRQRFAIKEVATTNPYIKARIELLEDSLVPKSKDFKALMGFIEDMSLRMIKYPATCPKKSCLYSQYRNPKFSSILLVPT